jgi:P-type Cu+ transporter
MATYIDPVCGMQLEPPKDVLETDLEERTYYFCSKECKERFEKNPKQYIGEFGKTKQTSAGL